MKANAFFNQSTFSILYYKYREYSLSAGIIFVCICIGIFVLFPQISSLIERQTAVNSTRDQITTLQTNVTTLTTLQSSDLTNDLNMVNGALPQSKDFGSIVRAVEHAAINSQVAIGDYTLQIGSLEGAQSADKNTSVLLNVTVNGTPVQISKFVTTITHQIPITDVSAVEGNIKAATVSLLFYYEPLPKVTINTTDAIVPFSVSDLQTLQTIKSFANQ